MLLTAQRVHASGAAGHTAALNAYRYAQSTQTMGFERLPGQSKQALDLLDPDRLLRVSAFVCAAHQRQSRLLDGNALPHLDFG